MRYPYRSDPPGRLWSIACGHTDVLDGYALVSALFILLARQRRENASLAGASEASACS